MDAYLYLKIVSIKLTDICSEYFFNFFVKIYIMLCKIGKNHD